MPDRLSTVAASAQSLPMLYEIGDVLEIGVLVLDRELIVRGWNEWLAVASAREPAEILGRPITEAFPELRGGAAEAAMHRALAGVTTTWAHQFHRYLVPIRSPAGQGRFSLMQQTARILPLTRGEETDGVLVLIEDVTERVAREEELRQALARAEVASQAKSDFLASMSHELRTPLSAIIGYMDLMTGDMVGKVDDLQKAYLRRVKSAAGHLIRVIEEILSFSRVSAGREAVQAEECDVRVVVAEVEELFEPQATHKAVALEVVVPEEPVLAWTDVTKLRQILINLVGNAMKFTSRGSVGIELELAGDRILLSVRDTGPGIAAADLERIFQPFTQLDQSLTRESGGTGLGLPLSRNLARLLGGDLTVQSVPGQGSRFSLWIPRQKEPSGLAKSRAADESLQSSS